MVKISDSTVDEVWKEFFDSDDKDQYYVGQYKKIKAVNPLIVSIIAHGMNASSDEISVMMISILVYLLLEKEMEKSSNGEKTLPKVSEQTGRDFTKELVKQKGYFKKLEKRLEVENPLILDQIFQITSLSHDKNNTNDTPLIVYRLLEMECEKVHL